MWESYDVSGEIGPAQEKMYERDRQRAVLMTPQIVSFSENGKSQTAGHRTVDWEHHLVQTIVPRLRARDPARNRDM